MTKMSGQAREEFLSKTRYGYLTTLREDGSPVSVPVWFEWDGQKISIFSGKNSAKVQRIQHNPQVTLLVANEMNEHETWVAFDGAALIRQTGGIELAERLAERYWDLSDPQRRDTLNSWKAAADALCVIELTPERIRTYVD